MSVRPATAAEKEREPTTSVANAPAVIVAPPQRRVRSPAAHADRLPRTVPRTRFRPRSRFPACLLTCLRACCYARCLSDLVPTGRNHAKLGGRALIGRVVFEFVDVVVCSTGTTSVNVVVRSRVRWSVLLLYARHNGCWSYRRNGEGSLGRECWLKCPSRSRDFRHHVRAPLTTFRPNALRSLSRVLFPAEHRLRYKGAGSRRKRGGRREDSAGRRCIGS